MLDSIDEQTEVGVGHDVGEATPQDGERQLVRQRHDAGVVGREHPEQQVLDVVVERVAKLVGDQAHQQTGRRVAERRRLRRRTQRCAPTVDERFVKRKLANDDARQSARVRVRARARTNTSFKRADTDANSRLMAADASS